MAISGSSKNPSIGKKWDFRNTGKLGDFVGGPL